MRIQITWDGGSTTGSLNDTPTARRVIEALPIVSRANTWGDEVYFDIGVTAALEPNAQQVVPPGTICFWVQGNSLALPFGPTPISQGDECRLAARVNILGQLDGDPKVLATVRDGTAIRVEPAE